MSETNPETMNDTNTLSSQALVRVADEPPAVLPAIIVEDLVPTPGPVVPVLIDGDARREAIAHAKGQAGFFVLVNRRSLRRAIPEPQLTPADEIVVADGSASLEPDKGAAGVAVAEQVSLADLAPVGILARLVRVFRLPDERVSALVQLLARVQPVEVMKSVPYLLLRVTHPVEVVHNQEEYQAVFRQLRINLQAFFEAHPSASDELKLAAANIEEPAMLADFVAQHLSRDFDERLAFLSELDVARRLRRALEVTIRELDLLTVGNRISQEIRDKVEHHQREYFLREQLRAIRTELGEEKDPAAMAVEELKKRLLDAGLPAHAKERADEELRRLSHLPPESPEHNVVRSYLEWIAALPWAKTTVDCTDTARARRVLDEDHYGLEDVKERILEFLAVRQLNPNKAGSLLCLAGPPGVGKTSLGKSIARALGREFYRFSVGGMRDEAEIKGHRRTYIGAMPGRILQGLRHTKTNNPVFMLDELDKIGSDWRGDPSSALLEVLDPAQNSQFLDHYLDLTFDLGSIVFIATVNVKTEIPDALRDRLEVIDLPGYIPEEKLQIASRYLLPRQRRDAGLSPRQLSVVKGALLRIVREYTHEAGVRELDRQLARICRKRASQVVAGSTGILKVGSDDVPSFLGPPKVQYDRIERLKKPGVAVGLAWTPVGGDVLFIEAVAIPGKGGLRTTGQLGEVMSESAQLALSYVKSRADDLGVDAERLRNSDVHLHFPAGAVKKDGPSAGITVTTALISLFSGKPLQPRLAMTGEMTLRGEVLPVGGVREKVVAARRVGVRTIILPERNRADVVEIPEEVRRHLTFVYASTYDDVLAVAFGPRQRAPSRRPKMRVVGKSARRSAGGGGRR